MSQIRFQQRDHDLMPDADDVLTHEKLDSLWEWFSAANKKGLPPYLIFAKLVNAARNPYRDQLLIARGGHELLTLGTSAYAPSEFTATPGLGEAQQQLEYREDKATIQALSAKVEFLEDAMNSQQHMINDLEDSLHLKQTIVQQLQDSLDAKHKTINQLEDRIDNLNLKQEELQTKAETEKKELENDIQVIRLKSKMLKQIQVALKSPHYGKFISITKEGATGIATSDGREALILIRHPNGTFSFRNNGNPIAYLSNSNKYSFRSNHICGNTEKFRLHYADHGKTYIESVSFPGSFLSPEALYPNELNWCCAKSVYSAFCIILT
ncbi:hypothetical protein BDZ91DRAFT_748744 [Kalaharituber pfeilii]|nr:hypothetical protein BDZ91DRAFT_748744 [Kalaharituber pfeilii]